MYFETMRNLTLGVGCGYLRSVQRVWTEALLTQGGRGPVQRPRGGVSDVSEGCGDIAVTLTCCHLQGDATGAQVV